MMTMMATMTMIDDDDDDDDDDEKDDASLELNESPRYTRTLPLLAPCRAIPVRSKNTLLQYNIFSSVNEYQAEKKRSSEFRTQRTTSVFFLFRRSIKVSKEGGRHQKGKGRKCRKSSGSMMIDDDIFPQAPSLQTSLKLSRCPSLELSACPSLELALSLSQALSLLLSSYPSLSQALLFSLSQALPLPLSSSSRKPWEVIEMP